MISIIVPVYNVEHYLRQCLDSILNQTYRDFEVLLIDDGSQDRSGEICDECSRKDNRIRVFHINNCGLAEVRNLGVTEAKGEYIGFVDSDDWIEPDMYEVLFNNIEETHADVCECGLWNEYEDFSKEFKPYITSKRRIEYDHKRALEALIVGSITNPVWNKLYKSAVFSDIVFPKDSYYEDIACMHRIVGKCNKVTVIPDPKYHYRQRFDSITQSRTAKNLVDYANACYERYAFFRYEYPDLYNAKYVDILQIVANGFSRVWRWWYGCESEEKERYSYRIKSFSQFSKEYFPLLGFPAWSIQLRVATLFLHFTNRFQFAVIYGMNQVYRWICRPFNARCTVK